jgi:hypothetical protein
MSIDEIPTTVRMSTSSINAALEYWFKNVIFRNEILVKSVSYKPQDHDFEIAFVRVEQLPEGDGK